MSSRPRDLKFWISAWLPVVIGIGIIVLESTESFGANHTSHPLRWLWEAIFGPVGNAQWEHDSSLIRKCGHFFGYGFIGVAWLRAWWMTLPHSHFLEDAFLALMGTSLVASLDELHQSYLPQPHRFTLGCAAGLHRGNCAATDCLYIICASSGPGNWLGRSRQ